MRLFKDLLWLRLSVGALVLAVMLPTASVWKNWPEWATIVIGSVILVPVVWVGPSLAGRWLDKRRTAKHADSGHG